MRILFVSTLYPSCREPTRGLFNRSRIEAMARLGHEVEVMAPIVTVPGVPQLRPGALPPREELVGEMRVWHPPFYRTPGCLIFWHDHFLRWSIRACFRRTVERLQPDHVILGFGFPDAAGVAPLCMEQGLSWSVLMHGSDLFVRLKQPRIGPKVLALLDHAPLVFCPGQVMATALHDAGVSPAKVVPFQNGVDPTRFHRRAGGEGMAVLFIGNLLAVKGADRLIPAWRAALASSELPAEAELQIIGSGPLEGEMRAAAQGLPQPSRVRFLGRLSHDEVAEQLGRAHCLILPSRSEGMPNVVVEALASGTPVVATGVGEVPYLVQTDRNGVVVAPESSELIAELGGAVARVLARAWDREAIAAPLRAQSWSAAAETMIAAIEALAKPGER